MWSYAYHNQCTRAVVQNRHILLHILFTCHTGPMAQYCCARMFLEHQNLSRTHARTPALVLYVNTCGSQLALYRLHAVRMQACMDKPITQGSRRVAWLWPGLAVMMMQMHAELCQLHALAISALLHWVIGLSTCQVGCLPPCLCLCNASLKRSALAPW